MKNDVNVWSADLGNGDYQNPIIHADYSDPDVIRVGDDFYMVSSSFQMTPCLPILHSKDLVNWKIINHVAEKLPYSSYDQPRHGDGVWAPSLRYHDGKFWVFFGMPDEGIYMSTARDPAGEWTPLHQVKKVKGWIDTCPFWDDDGNAYLVSAFARSRIGFKSILHMSRMKPDGTELLDDGRHIFDGNEHHPTIEGPKMYKRNGYYYIFAPAGGVSTGWQTILRSKNVFGPYEDKIVLHQGNTEINGPHQGGWIDTNTGEDWFIHFQDKDAYGRIVHLQPMHWEDDWPVMGINQKQDGIGEPVVQWKKPNVGSTQEIRVPQINDDFSQDKLGLQWQWRANQQKNWYRLADEGLRLFASHQPATKLYDLPNIVTQKFPADAFRTTVHLTANLSTETEAAGLVILGFDYASISLSKAENGYVIQSIHGNKDTDEQQKIIKSIDDPTVFFRAEVDSHQKVQFSYSIDGDVYHLIDESFTATKGQWIGAQIGLYCVNNHDEQTSAYSDFHSFVVDCGEK